MRSSSDARLLAASLAIFAAACPEPVEAPPDASIAAPTPQPDAGQALNAPPDDPEAAIVVSVGGAVELRRADSDAWVALKVGDAVRVGDQVRTAPDAKLDLSFRTAQLALQEDSNLVLTVLQAREVDADVTGTVEVEMQEGRVKLKGGAATGRTSGGRLTLSFDGEKTTVTALKGTASLTVGEQSVELAEGSFATSTGTALSKPAKVPKGVSLAVSWPPETVTNKAELSVAGRASPFARVLVQGRKVIPGPDGAFETKVALKRGRQTVVVTVIDPLGRRATRTREVVFDPDAPTIKTRVKYR